MVFGLEAAFDAGSLKGNVASPAFPATDVWHSKIDDLITTTAHFGYSMGMWLPYVKAGRAWGHVTSSADCLTPGCTPSELWKNSQWQNGGTIGGGIDFLLAPNWIIGIEYDYIALASKNHRALTNNGGPGNANVSANINMVLGRVSYKFGN